MTSVGKPAGDDVIDGSKDKSAEEKEKKIVSASYEKNDVDGKVASKAPEVVGSDLSKSSTTAKAVPSEQDDVHARRLAAQEEYLKNVEDSEDEQLEEKPALEEKRFALDGKPYTKSEFLDFFGPELGEQSWRAARKEAGHDSQLKSSSGPLIIGPDLSRLPNRGGYNWIRSSNTSNDRSLRYSAASQTMAACQRGYTLNVDGEKQTVKFKHIDEMVRGTMFVRSSSFKPAASSDDNSLTTEIISLDGFSMNVALTNAQSGARVVTINAASAYHVGGGFGTGGRHALEESMCVQSTLFASLQAASKIAERERVRPSKIAIKNWLEARSETSKDASSENSSHPQMSREHSSSSQPSEISNEQSKNSQPEKSQPSEKSRENSSSSQPSEISKEQSSEKSKSTLATQASLTSASMGKEQTSDRPRFEVGAQCVIISEKLELSGSVVTVVGESSDKKSWVVAVPGGKELVVADYELLRKDEETNGRQSPPLDKTSADVNSRTSASQATTERAIAAGDKVVLSGISQKPEMNGTLCIVIAWDAKADKWIVQMPGGGKARLDTANLAVQPVEESMPSNRTTEGKLGAGLAGPIAGNLRLLKNSPKASPRGQQGATRVKRGQPKARLHCHIPEDGAIISPSVEVFRGSSMEGYPFKERPVVINVVSLAMPNCNPRCRDSPVDRPVAQVEYEMLLRSKAIAMFAASKVLDAEVVVLPSIGCGVFENNPQLLGSIIGDVLRSDFRNVFKKVVVVDTDRFGASFLGAAVGDAPKPAIVDTPHPLKGAQKVITGLKSAPDMNGLTCTVEAWDEAAGQWIVVLRGKTLRIGDDNLMEPDIF